MTTRCHHMPFGAEVLSDGRVRFRLWAPAARKVELCLQGNAPQISLQMAAEDNGWFGIVTELAAAEVYYRYRVDGELEVSDPASRYQPQDAFGPSQVINPKAFQWQDQTWRGRPWEETVIYELHVGAFTPEGTFSAVKERLDYLRQLGVTAIQLMPIGEFPGRHNWGYDGVLFFAPDSAYGTVDDLKDLIQATHAKGLMVFLDVVYNHFGPEGNFIAAYAPGFFTSRHHTPWGKAMNFDGSDSAIVRNFIIHNALYWLEEYHFDGLRLDAVHTILDDSTPHLLEELCASIRRGPGADRHIHLMLENDANAARFLRPSPHYRTEVRYNAQWNDDFHHSLHCLLTGEFSGYYQDYKPQPIHHLARCLCEGFAYQGETSSFRDNLPRGERSADLPPGAFINFLQNHDQVGNRPLGERITALSAADAVRAATVLLLLAPSPPLLFMGQEWGSKQPFLFFVDFPEQLGRKVTRGRHHDYRHFPQFAEKRDRKHLPPPNHPQTFIAAKLAWEELGQAQHQQWLALHRELLCLRVKTIKPLLKEMSQTNARYELRGERTVKVIWKTQRRQLIVIANLGDDPQAVDWSDEGSVLYATHEDISRQLLRGILKPWTVAWCLTAQ